MTYYIGCSGFYYKEWKEIFYPSGMPAKDWFQYYCRHFNTIEINASFYRAPALKTLQNWYNQSPGDFLFSVKAPKYITHIKRFELDKEEVNAFGNLMAAGLQHKLANILYQLPPSFTYTPYQLDLICRKVDNGFNNIIEFRHESWWQQEVYDRLSQGEITF